ncbi:hypothetical protein BDZ90DRAFT_91384 [Jaminaea rosea]|uniref:Mitochondrial distribution and morphology protein 34 n=1 Tax=Jaminaea rosea TaxID=1569628 RepID=A0A316UI35_9BASI|nr:hypothetical protein BDZ90DRAFT_91384 [Jaminaea rosea]PWN24997.1 hypothetical protein BDZ90DRAFT_91384 [Jaminaea rosea]
MSFNFEWPSPFSPSFHAHALSLLTSALNRGPKPKVIADDIEVTELNMGSVPPDLEILEIGELGRERFRGIFRLTYAGDAHVVVQTRVQVNPLSGGAAPSDARASTTSEETFTPFASGRGILFAATPLIVPMRLTLSHVRLRAIIVLVVSKSKGITLVFKNDPLESVQVSSTFDSVAVVAKYLQQEIEGQLKEVFREDLPGIIHRLSQTWLSGRNKASEGKVAEDQAAVAGPSKSNGTRTRKRSSAASVPAAPPSQSPASPKSPHKRPPAAPRSSSAAPPSRTKPTPRPPSPPTADIPPPLSDYYQEGADSYDPTYGLREDEWEPLPAHQEAEVWEGCWTMTRRSMKSKRRRRTRERRMMLMMRTLVRRIALRRRATTSAGSATLHQTPNSTAKPLSLPAWHHAASSMTMAATLHREARRSSLTADLDPLALQAMRVQRPKGSTRDGQWAPKRRLPFLVTPLHPLRRSSCRASPAPTLPPPLPSSLAGRHSSHPLAQVAASQATAPAQQTQAVE